MNNKIDAVIAYVNSDDEIWRKEFSEYNQNLSKDVNNGLMRYHDAGTLKLVIDSIRKFAPGINQIHIIVAYESQVPEWIDDSINIIYHRDFVPREYLPMFNACALEIFFPFLNDVSERFIYFNDDMILTRPTSPDEFFDDNGNPYSTISIVRVKKHENRTLINCYNLIIGVNQAMYEGFSIHGPSAFRKEGMKECYNKYKQDLLKSISPQRRSMFDFNQYVYQLYQLVYKNTEYKEFSGKCLYNNMKTYASFDGNTLGDYTGICVNADNIEKYVEIIRNHINNYE